MVVIDSKEFSSLSAYAVKLIIDLYAQFKGSNNGDLCAAWSMMEKRGWRSKGTLHRAVSELREKGFLLLARQGEKHKASLYALSFLAVDECWGKLEIPPTAAPPGTRRPVISGTGNGAATSLRCCRAVPVTGTAGAIIGCRRASAFWGLGCPKTHHEIKDSLEHPLPWVLLGIAGFWLQCQWPLEEKASFMTLYYQPEYHLNPITTPILCLILSIAAVSAFYRWFDGPPSHGRHLSASSYAIYVLHFPLCVWTSWLLLPFQGQALTKLTLSVIVGIALPTLLYAVSQMLMNTGNKKSAINSRL